MPDDDANLPSRVYRRKPAKADFEGRTVRRHQPVGHSTLRFWFSDGGAFSLQAVFNERLGIPVVELVEGLFETGEIVPHPCAGYSPAQRKVFECIAEGGVAPYRRSTLDRLLSDGLITKVGKRCVGKDAFGNLWVDAYEVPALILDQLHAWRAQNGRSQR